MYVFDEEVFALDDLYLRIDRLVNEYHIVCDIKQRSRDDGTCFLYTAISVTHSNWEKISRIPWVFFRDEYTSKKQSRIFVKHKGLLALDKIISFVNKNGEIGLDAFLSSLPGAERNCE